MKFIKIAILSLCTLPGLYAAESKQKAEHAEVSAATEAEFKKSSDQTAVKGYRKDIVDLVLQHGYPKQHDGAWLFSNDATMEVPSFEEVGWLCHIDENRDNYDDSRFFEYVVQYEDVASLQKFFEMPRRISPSHASRAAGQAIKTGNKGMLETIFKNRHCVPYDPLGQIDEASWLFDNHPNMLNLLIAQTKTIYPDNWQSKLGECLKKFPYSNAARYWPAFNHLLAQGANPDQHPVLHEYVRAALAEPDLTEQHQLIPFIKTLAHRPGHSFEVVGPFNQTVMKQLDIKGTKKQNILLLQDIVLAPLRQEIEQSCGELSASGTGGAWKHLSGHVLEYLFDTQELIKAIYRGKETQVAQLVDAGFDPNVKNEGKKTALMYAAERGQSSSVSSLLRMDKRMKEKEKTARLDAQEEHGMTALMLAARAGHDETVALLLQAGAGDARILNARTTYNSPETKPASKTHIRRGNRNTYISHAGGKHEMITDDRADRTALHLAAKNGHIAVVQRLIAAKADATIVDAAHKTALDYAKERNDEALIKLLSAQ